MASIRFHLQFDRFSFDDVVVPKSDENLKSLEEEWSSALKGGHS